LWWWTLGKQIESVFGFSGLLIIFCITAIIPNVIQYWISGPNFGGLSGVVYGLVGFVWWIGWLRPNWGLWLPKPMIGFMLVWLVLGYTDILWVSVANSAHTSGLISGCVLAFIWSRFGSANPDTNTS
jgi:GlpG protein